MLLISEDLEEILAIADRIAVMFDGRLSAGMADGAVGRRPHRPRHGRRLPGRNADDGAGDAGHPEDGGMRLERRETASRTALVLAPLAAIGVTLLICALLVAWAGAPVGRTYLLLLEGGFGSRFALTETLTRATPLILTGLAVAVAFRARLFNIGAEGQFYAGALAAVAVGGLHGATGFGLPDSLLYGLMIAAAMGAGALLLIVPAWLKTRLSVDEVVTTLLLNFIALLFVSAMLDGPMKDPTALGWPQSVAIKPELEFGRLLEKLSAAYRIPLGHRRCAGAAMDQPRHRPRLRDERGRQQSARRVVPRHARECRDAQDRRHLRCAGGPGGRRRSRRPHRLRHARHVARATATAASSSRCSPDSRRCGWCVASIFVAGILVGADSMSRVVGVPNYIADVIVAVSLLTMLVASMLVQYRIRRSRPTGT